VVGNDTFATTLTFNPISPAGTVATASAPAGQCPGLPAGAPVVCTLPFAPFPPTLDLTLTTPFAQQCTAQPIILGPITVTQTSAFAGPVTLVLPVVLGNTIPANPALCSTPIPNTPTPVPTVVIPSIEPIPQVVQNPARGGIFNGSRNDTPTPVRPAAVAPVAVNPGAVTLRPPSTGDAGMPRLLLLRLDAF
jgi:hypothetical protein